MQKKRKKKKKNHVTALFKHPSCHSSLTLFQASTYKNLRSNSIATLTSYSLMPSSLHGSLVCKQVECYKAAIVVFIPPQNECLQEYT